MSAMMTSLICCANEEEKDIDTTLYFEIDEASTESFEPVEATWTVDSNRCNNLSVRMSLSEPEGSREDGSRRNLSISVFSLSETEQLPVFDTSYELSTDTNTGAFSVNYRENDFRLYLSTASAIGTQPSSIGGGVSSASLTFPKIPADDGDEFEVRFLINFNSDAYYSGRMYGNFKVDRKEPEQCPISNTSQLGSLEPPSM
jgi:hypothetical protein